MTKASTLAASVSEKKKVKEKNEEKSNPGKNKRSEKNIAVAARVKIKKYDRGWEINVNGAVDIFRRLS